MRLILSLEDACEVQTHAASPVVREILAHARQVLDGHGQIVIQNEFANAPTEIMRVIRTLEELDRWLDGAA
jgi:hypothetical protein